MKQPPPEDWQGVTFTRSNRRTAGGPAAAPPVMKREEPHTAALPAMMGIEPRPMKPLRKAPAQDKRRTSAPQDLRRARAMQPPGYAQRPDGLSPAHKKIPANVACMLLLQFSGNPLYILFFYLFLFLESISKIEKEI